MKIEFMSNLPPIGDSVAKMASEGGQLLADIISTYGFFAFCLAFVGFCLIVPVRMYEKYYHVADDEAETNVELTLDTHEASNSAA